MSDSVTQMMTPAELRSALNLRMSEREFQRHVVTLAESLGWWTYHVYYSERSNPGFPDLLLVRERVIYVEIKAEKGRLTLDQELVLNRLAECGQEVFVWRPSDWDAVCEVLAR